MPVWRGESNQVWWMNEITGQVMAIPHPPTEAPKGCRCTFCKHKSEGGLHPFDMPGNEWARTVTRMVIRDDLLPILESMAELLEKALWAARDHGHSDAFDSSKIDELIGQIKDFRETRYAWIGRKTNDDRHF